jgi:tripartite-type tricarboxylate transporter receptor subunit TctC
MNTRRKVSKLLALATLCAPMALMAQAFPSKPITLVVPVPPGGLVDTSARLISEPLGRLIGQSIVVENKGGASGNLAYQQVARSAKDGHTLLVSYSGYHVANPILMSKLPWELKDLTPVGLITVATNVVAVHPSVPVNNMKEFIAYAKQNPGKLNYAGRPGAGVHDHAALGDAAHPGRQAQGLGRHRQKAPRGHAASAHHGRSRLPQL